MSIIGVDPGISGAIVELNEKIITYADMPTKKIVVGGKNRNTIDLEALRDILKLMDSKTAYVEKVQSMPQNGGVQNFNFGMAYGQILGSLTSLNIRTELVTPQAWKKALGVTSDKATSVAAFHQIFPNNQDMVRLKKHIDRAEASLIGYYGVQQEKYK